MGTKPQDTGMRRYPDRDLETGALHKVRTADSLANKHQA